MHSFDIDNPPEFFSLTPGQYRWLVEEVRFLRTAKPIELLRRQWKAAQAEYPDAPRGWKAGVRNAVKRGHDWSLNPKEWVALTCQPCAVCGGSVGNGIGLDRLDNKQGYHYDNVRPCCGPCNIARGMKPLERKPK